MPLTDWELWACAQHVIDAYGDEAADHVFDRVIELAKKGDEEGIATWQAIGERVEKLKAEPANTDTRH